MFDIAVFFKIYKITFGFPIMIINYKKGVGGKTDTGIREILTGDQSIQSARSIDMTII
jgi:hypothetical protein